MNRDLNTNLINRDALYQNLLEEFIGPSVSENSLPLDTNKFNIFNDYDEYMKTYKDKNTDEEILKQTPTRRYGIAILYPKQTIDESMIENDQEEIEIDDIDSVIHKEAQKDLDEIDNRSVDNEDIDDIENIDMVSANAYQQSSMAISFRADLPLDGELIIYVNGGRYHSFPIAIKVKDEERQQNWWVRRAVSIVSKVKASKLLSSKEILVQGEVVHEVNTEGLNLKIKILSRPLRDNQRLITVSLVNETEKPEDSSIDYYCFFQASLRAKIVSPDHKPRILPYPEYDDLDVLDEDELSLALIYRKAKTYAVGHGCAADWGDVFDGKTFYVRTDFLPTYETKSMTPNIKRDDGTEVEVSMRDLAGLNPHNDGLKELEEIVDLYERWINERWKEVDNLESVLIPIAEKNLRDCEICLRRMKRGLEYLKNPLVNKAFKLANEAMLLQQIMGENVRFAEITDEGIHFNTPYQKPNLDSIPKNKGKWRAFQIAFILMAMESAAESDSPERETVDLLFFPTGGGKTEAYLGLAAFSIFMRRLKNQSDSGVHVLMRYTLRLLTADQFQRASRLICAMEYIRQHNQDILGEDEFSIGIWVGADTTPNTHKSAIKNLKELRDGKSKNNPFLITSCPWCGALIGKLPLHHSASEVSMKNKNRKKTITHNHSIQGYKIDYDKVVIHCTDSTCPYSNRLPVYVIDEDIYEKKPTFIIGTIDKFVQLAWNPNPRTIFGIGKDGKRFSSPPGLIIQDELHLISGPLGSMSGLFEVLIEELCTDFRKTKPVKPKIICSTATIRKYKKQILDLYARTNVTLFPSPGLDADDSFFATVACDQDGTPMPGRKYVGVNAPSLGSMQTLQVRSLTTLLQAPMYMDEKERDPWWTLLVFFNSLRELGTTVTLLQSDIPNHLKVIRKRNNLDYKDLRHLTKIKELTSRLSSEEVASAIGELKTKVGEGIVTDICLASNIIEVGVDIDRLSLMVVVGQPKTTAQYIQVTGRIGRRWYERPGLVVTLYSASKPRDRSHFEKFRSYHEKLYAQVEPTSVTPFSPSVVDRMLHAVMVGYVRQLGSLDEVSSPTPVPEQLLSQLRDIICKRVKLVDHEELENVKKVFERRIKEWKTWQPREWTRRGNSDGYPLLYPAGEYVDSETKKISWSTPNSMRNVDAQCMGEISVLYLLQDELGEI